MNILSIDCEYAQPSGKTIQIGAAAFKARTGELLGTFEMFVDPGEEITEYITNLTGITNENVKGAPKILEAYLALKDFHRKHKCFKNAIVWGSGTRNDASVIHQEAYPTKELQDENHNFLGFRVLDTKTLFQSMQVHNNKTVRGGLKATCDRLGIGFEGQAHTALADAINTFRVWHFLVTKMPKGF